MFILAAKEYNHEGLLPPVVDLAWRLRLAEKQVADALSALSQVGVAIETPDGWLLVNYKKRQAATSNKDRKRLERSTRSHTNVTICDTEVEEESEVENRREGEEEVEVEAKKPHSDSFTSLPVFIPLTPKEACSHPDIQTFQSVTGRIPGQSQYGLVIETVHFLQQRFPGPEELVKYLQPFWLSWSSRKTRHNGRSYDPSNLAWLVEWAVNDCIPPEYDPVQPARTKSERNREILENWRKDGQT